MAKKRVWFAILAIALVFVITVAAGCTILDDLLNQNGDDDTSGSSSGSSNSTFTLTGIPSKYNGKYAIFMVDGEGIVGAQSIDFNNEIITLVKISGGKVTLPMWIINSNGTGFDKFTGNRTFGADKSTVGIFENNKWDGSAEGIITALVFDSVVFKNGSASKSWSDGREDTGSSEGGNEPGTDPVEPNPPPVDPALLNGTWIHSSGAYFTFSNGSFETGHTNGQPATKGTYATSGNVMTVTITHVYGSVLNDAYGVSYTSDGTVTDKGEFELKWYTKEEVMASPDYVSADEDTKASLISSFQHGTETYTYSVNGDQLTLTIEGQQITLYKR